jgi:hypothetical protein
VNSAVTTRAGENRRKRVNSQSINQIGFSGNHNQPTTQQVTVHDELKERAATYRQRLKLLLEQDVTAFNALLRQRNVPNVITDMQ